MRTKRITLICLLTAALCLLPGISVWADAASGFPDMKGSITIHMKDVDTGEAVPGGTLCFYQVARPSNGAWVYTKAFEECSLTLEDPGAADLSLQLDTFVQDYGIEGREVAVGDDAVLEIADLPPGLYLVDQMTPAKEYSPIRPFLVSVPSMVNGEYVFDVDATPKLELKKESPPPPNPPSPPVPPTPHLPQTGQLWWPVLVLAAAGMLFVLFGVKKNRTSST